MTLTPYLMFDGNCEAALNFYAKALKGEIKDLSRFAGSPADNISADGQKVLHAHFAADGIFFMASDGGSGTVGSSVHLSIGFDSVEDLDRTFTALSEGARITMPLQDTFWGARFGMLQDRFGVNWMFNHDKPKQP